MKFGKELTASAHPTFKNYYIAYKDLKEAIKIITGEATPGDDAVSIGAPILEMLQRSASAGPAAAITRTPESQFQELLDHELHKINNFSTVQFAVLIEEIRELIYRLTHVGLSSFGDDIADSIESLRSEIVAFDEYIRLNFSGFRKALKKFDKWNKSDSSNWFLQRIVRSDFMQIQIDKLLQGLSVIESAQRSRYERVNACDPLALAIYTQPATFRRAKYFVSPDELVEIETMIMKQADVVYAYPLTQPVPSSLAQVTEAFGRGRGVPCGEMAYTESVVVFDNDDFAQYAVRRNKRPTSGPLGYTTPVFSVRWNQFQQKEGKCCLVREVHPRNANSGDILCVLEVKQRNLTDLLAMKLSLESFIAAEGLGASNEVKNFLNTFVADFLPVFKPVAMYSYRRTLFKDDSVAIAVDKDIKFIDLRPLAGKAFFDHPLTQFQSILTQRTMTVWQPRSAASPPAFLQEIIGKPSVSEVVGFSKAVHAQAVLHVVTELERPVAVGLPHWFLHTISGEDSKAKFANLASANDEEFMASPLASPSTAGKFDVLPSSSLADSSSRLLLHDIVSAKEPKQQVSDGSSAMKSTTPLMPAPAPLIGSGLEAPLLDRRRVSPRRSSQSLIHQIKFVLFGSVAQEIPEPTTKIEPKTLLANERTFLNWCFVAFIVAAAAVTLHAVDPEANIEAACLSLTSVFTLAWSLNVYRLRVIALRNMKTLDTLLVSSNGATIVCLSVAFALSVTWLGRYRQYMETLSGIV